MHCVAETGMYKHYLYTITTQCIRNNMESPVDQNRQTTCPPTAVLRWHKAIQVKPPVLYTYVG